MRWVGHVAGMGKERNMYKVLVGSQKERTTWKIKE
jgi:hypothetical protein